METNNTPPSADQRTEGSLKRVAGELDALALLMRSTAAKMEYFGGFDGAMKQHADELAGAANIARGWAKGIRARLANAPHELPPTKTL